MTTLDLLSGPAASATAPATILFGLDDKRKNHASWFTAEESDDALKAATLMGMVTLPVTTRELTALASDLPHGKIFGSGKAFVPFVKGPLFDKLVANLPDGSDLAQLRASAAAAEVANQPAAKTYTIPKDRSVLAVGNLVLASEGEGHGWWEAVVEAVTGEMVTLSWRDWADEPRFVRQRDQIGLLPVPKSTAN